MYAIRSYYALTRTRNCIGGEALNKFDAIYSILAKYGCTSLFLMDDRAHHQHQGFADYLVLGKIELKLGEDVITSYSIHYTKLYETPTAASHAAWRRCFIRCCTPASGGCFASRSRSSATWSGCRASASTRRCAASSRRRHRRERRAADA